ncbi:hypothetical protein K458DRAFT_386846 [Lentithecium fluviatile CBS 122367]|uniref:Uncharacterized protein n=1 Tax=Lentithecium fluviatile CBS 122367 TaxID=1168545 RepID=A0A6G1J8Y2_9PLEO|nr:hypothetical protein K458DRAFT_386846 [Lentithecium fluviatile CBS 122367]
MPGGLLCVFPLLDANAIGSWIGSRWLGGTTASIIAALGPDGDQVAYDNVLWSAIFTVSSGAIPGCESLSLSQYFEAWTLEAARKICECWQDDESNPRKSSRRGKLRAGKYPSEMMNFASRSLV